MHKDGMTPAEIVEWIEKRTGTRVSIPTVYRWMLKGVHGTRLHATRVGGKSWRVRPEALEALLDWCNTRQPTPRVEPNRQQASRLQPVSHRSTDRQRQIRETSDGLRKKLGIHHAR